jgi:hypothetical protein
VAVSIIFHGGTIIVVVIRDCVILIVPPESVTFILSEAKLKSKSVVLILKQKREIVKRLDNSESEYLVVYPQITEFVVNTELLVFNPRANYTDRATASCRQN